MRISNQNKLLFLLIISFVICGAVEALIVSAPPRVENERHESLSSQQRVIQSIRLRSTQESDVQEISEILASALVRTDVSTRFNWKSHIELLRTKSGVEALLRSRVQAINIGKQVICPLELDEADRLRFLWSNDRLRKQIEKAALLSSEPHIWTGHNFACAPESSCWLQHKMITATDALSGEIVGFCEVAMLSRPSDSGEDEIVFVPTIMNLATSPNYRRQGIASRLIKSTSRFIRQQWKCDELSLYVDGENEAAMSLYLSMGFAGRVIDSRSNDDCGSKVYMAKQFIPSFV